MSSDGVSGRSQRPTRKAKKTQRPSRDYIAPEFHVKQPELVLGRSVKHAWLIKGNNACPVVDPSYNLIWIGTTTHPSTTHPGWKRDIAAGIEAGTDYERHIYTNKQPAYAGTRTSTESYYCNGTRLPRTEQTDPVWQSFSNAQWTPFAEDIALRDVALSKMRSFANQADKLTNVVVPVAELRDFRATVQGIARLTEGLVSRTALLIDSFSSARSLRGKKLSEEDILSHAGESWLTYSFGVKPMIKDAQDISEALASAILTDRFYRISAKSEKVWHGSSIGSGADFGWLTSGTYRRSHQFRLTYRYTYGFKSSLDSYVSYTNVSDHLGFTIGNFVPALWELIPYSWLIDYFGNIGDVLQDTFESQRNPRFGCLSTRFEEKIKIVGQPKALSSSFGPPLVLNAGNQEVSHIYYRRQKQTGLPSRSFRFRTTDEIAHNATNKLLNLLSILSIRNRNDLRKLRYLKR